MTVSHWFDELGKRRQRPALRDHHEVDVLIVGAGYTGLWTAYCLLVAHPGRSVIVVDAEHVGFGASGRNGGWLSASIAGDPARLSRQTSVEAVRDLRRHMRTAVDEVLATLDAEGIDCHQLHGGTLRVATTPAGLARLREQVAAEHAWGATADDIRMLDAAKTIERIRIAGALGAHVTPHCARIQPALLVTGLADAVERRGGLIFESSPVLSVESGMATLPGASVRAGTVVLATEGFTCRLPGRSRQWLPMNSSMVVTSRLPDDLWQSIGWAGSETLADDAHAYVYAQRTSDNRIAIGGRGVPYRYANSFDSSGSTDQATIDALRSTMTRLLPQVAGCEMERAWSGVLAVPRDWQPTVMHHPARRLAYAGGYVGNGVTAAYLAGATLADLIDGRDTSRTRLPWVGHLSRTWEVEPVRWIGARSMYLAYRRADRDERQSANERTSPLARVADRISGR